MLVPFAQAFAAGWQWGSTRFLHMAHELGQRGWTTRLLCAGGPGAPPAEPESADSPFAVIRTPFGAYPLAWDRRGFRCAYRTMLALRTDPRARAGYWGPRAAAWWARCHGDSRPSLIWAPVLYWTHTMSAGLCLSRELGVPWVMEFRDPFPAPGGRARPDERAYVARCLNDCSAVVTTTTALASRMACEYPWIDGKLAVIPNAYDPSEFGVPARPPISADSLVLLHAGYLPGGAGRSVSSLVHAIAAVAHSRPETRGKIRLRLQGSGPGQWEARKVADALGVPAAVSVEGLVPRACCLAAMQSVDVLVLAKFPSRDYDLQVPGKTYEYLATGKPVIALMHECEAAEILRRAGVGLQLRPDDIRGQADALLRLWELRGCVAGGAEPDWEYVRQYSREHFGQRLMEVIDRVLGTHALVPPVHPPTGRDCV